MGTRRNPYAPRVPGWRLPPDDLTKLLRLHTQEEMTAVALAGRFNRSAHWVRAQLKLAKQQASSSQVWA